MNSAAAPAAAALAPEASASAAADLPRYVRVLQRGPGDLVRFEFAIGWPDLSSELVLPEAAFTAFCATQKAGLLPEGEPEGGAHSAPGLIDEEEEDRP